MTWLDWCASEYNTNGFYTSNNTVYSVSGLDIHTQEGLSIVSGTSIEAEGIYIVGKGGNEPA